MFRSATTPTNPTLARIFGAVLDPGWRDWLTSSLAARPVALDRVERGFVSMLYVAFAYRLLTAHSTNDWLTVCLALAAEGLAVVLINIRKPPSGMSFNLGDWVLAFCGSMAPLLVDFSGAAQPVPHMQTAIVILIMCGTFVQLSAKIILWRSFGIVAANRGVKVQGPYRFVRHPMYAGYTMTHVGILLAFPSVFNAALYATALSLQIARLTREERILRQDPMYQEFAGRVRYRLLPGVF